MPTYPLTIPTNGGYRSVTLRQINVSAVSTSPFTLHQQVVSHAGARWEADISLPPMARADAAVWVGFLSSLRGVFGSFIMGPPDAASPLGSAGGSPLIEGAGQTGDTINLDGATASQTGWLKAGDYVQIGDYLKVVLADADSDGSGNVQIEVWPEVRNAVADNTALITASPTGLWRLASNDLSYDIDSVSLYGISFSAVEVVG